MIYKNTVAGIFISRPNRFIANVLIDGKEEIVHVKNTGRCKELLLYGVKVILCKSDNPARKTQYDLISVYKENFGWVNIDSQVPNVLVREWLDGGKSIFDNITYLKQEYCYSNSRIDFYIECKNRRILIEVKGCTLEINGKGYFPDAPTERGVKHLYELSKAVNDGYECYIAFVIAMNGIDIVYPNVNTHPQFGVALENAINNGVKVLYLQCDVTENSIKIK